MKSRIFQLLHSLLPLLLVICAVTPAAAQKLVLLHEGEMTFFEKGDISAALEKSLPNDTIFLPETIIPGNFTVTKDVTIMGCGQNSVISGDVIIAPEDDAQWQNVLFDGVRITGDLYSTAPTNGLHMRNSRVDGVYQPDKNGCVYDVRNLVFESCKFNDVVKFGREAKNVILLNCVIGTINGYNSNNLWQLGEVVFVNSTLLQYGDGYENHNLCGINSVFYCHNGAQKFLHSNESVFQNCLIIRRFGSEPLENGLYADCIFLDDMDFFFANDKGLTVENLLENNCIGNDGTVMGHLGGLGYSLEPSLPYIKEKEIKTDNGTGELKVHLIIGGIKSEDQ